MCLPVAEGILRGRIIHTYLSIYLFISVIKAGSGASGFTISNTDYSMGHLHLSQCISSKLTFTQASEWHTCKVGRSANKFRKILNPQICGPSKKCGPLRICDLHPQSFIVIWRLKIFAVRKYLLFLLTNIAYNDLIQYVHNKKIVLKDCFETELCSIW
jgi:hypothetical protein